MQIGPLKFRRFLSSPKGYHVILAPHYDNHVSCKNFSTLSRFRKHLRKLPVRMHHTS